MDATDPVPADVIVAASQGEALAHEAEEALRALGVDATTSVAPPRRALDGLQWAVLVVLPVNAFLGGLGSKLGADAYEELKKLVGRLLRREPERTPARSSLVLQDTESGLRVILEPDLPAESYRRLFDLELEAVDGRVLRYEHERGWHDAEDASG